MDSEASAELGLIRLDHPGTEQAEKIACLLITAI